MLLRVLMSWWKVLLIDFGRLNLFVVLRVMKLCSVVWSWWMVCMVFLLLLIL